LLNPIRTRQRPASWPISRTAHDKSEARRMLNAPKGSGCDQVDFDAIEVEVEELLTVLQDRQPGMTAFHPLVVEHIERINKIAAPLLKTAPRPASWLRRCLSAFRAAAD
jgi:hypothetical protein